MISFPLFSRHNFDMANPISDRFHAISNLYDLLKRDDGICAKVQTVAFGILAGVISLLGVGIFTPLIFRYLVYSYVDWYGSSYRSQGATTISEVEPASSIEFDWTLRLKASFLTTPIYHYAQALNIEQFAKLASPEEYTKLGFSNEKASILERMMFPRILSNPHEFSLALEALNSDEQDVVIDYMLAFANAYMWMIKDQNHVENLLKARPQECPESTFRKLFFLFLYRESPSLCRDVTSTFYINSLSSNRIQYTLQMLKEQNILPQNTIHRTGEFVKPGEKQLRGYGAPV